MKREIKKKDFLPSPEFPGGPKALSAFISQNINYPPEAIAMKIEGTVVVKTEINHKGVVIDTKVISGIGYGCNEEAARVVKLLKFRIDKVRNVKVSFFKTFNIHFKLDLEKQTNSGPSVNYIYIENSKTERDLVDDKSKIIQYKFVIHPK